MKKIVLAILVVLVIASLAVAQSIIPDLVTISETYYQPDKTSGVSSFSANAATQYAKQAYVQVNGGPLRYYLNGGTPTTKLGLIAYDGDFIPMFTPYDIQGFRFIADDSAASGLGTTVYVIFKGTRR